MTEPLFEIRPAKSSRLAASRTLGSRPRAGSRTGPAAAAAAGAGRPGARHRLTASAGADYALENSATHPEIALTFFLFLLIVGLAALAAVRIAELGRQVRRLREHQQELSDWLERRLERTERRLDEAPGESPARPAAAKPAVEEAAEERRQAIDEALPRRETATAAEPEPVEHPRAEPAWRPVGESPVGETADGRAANELGGETEHGIDWEQWLGIRGAAIAAGVLVALASLFFFKYSIDRGLLSPTVRVILGTVAGLAAIAGSQRLRRRYVPAANALAGGGLVALYASFWSAHALFGLIPSAVATLALLAVVTLACGALAAAYRSRVIASLGLAGGFLTPVFLASALEPAIGLYAYLLLLDLGLVALARRRGWTGVAVAGLIATILHVGWLVFGSGRPIPVHLTLGALLAFSLLFALFARSSGEPEESRSRSSIRLIATIFPFALALDLAARVELDLDLGSLAGFVALLSLLAGWLDRARPAGRTALRLSPLAAVASVGTVGSWIATHRLEAGTTWQVAAVAVGLGALYAAVGGVRQDPESGRRSTPAVMLAVGGLAALLILAALRTPYGWLAWWIGLISLAAVASAWATRFWPPAHLVGHSGLGLGLAVLMWRTSGYLPDVGWPLFFGCCLAAAVAAAVLAARRRGSPDGPFAQIGAAVVPVLLLLGLAAVVDSARPVTDSLTGPMATFVATLFLSALLAALAAVRDASAVAFAAALAAATIASFAATGPLRGETTLPAAASLFAGLLATVLLFTFAPLLFSAGSAAGSLGRLRTLSAAAGPLTLWPLLWAWRELAGTGVDGLLPLLPGGAALAAAVAWRRRRPDAPARDALPAWLLVAGLALAATAIPLQLSREWVTIGWALTGVAALGVWSRLRQPSLAWFGLGLLTLVAIRLLANPAVLAYHPAGEAPFGRWPVLNWLAYTYLLPAACLFGAGRLLATPDPAAPATRAARGAVVWRRAGAACHAAGILVVFAWINLTIFDAFRTAPRLALDLDRQPARDLTLSIAWAAYALVLLAVGLRRRIPGLRRSGLALLLLTLSKLFLYDLGELEDLYRVGAILGLAVSLFVVSFAYQRLARPSAGDDPRP